MYSILFFHGWGFDINFWNPLTEQIKNKYEIIKIDNGYFNNKTAFNKISKKHIVVAHSFGIIKMINYIDHTKCQAIINIAGTVNFTKKQKLIETMINHLNENCIDVLNKFYINCNSKKIIKNKSIDVNRQNLITDLNILKTNNIEKLLMNFANLMPLLNIYASDDRIINIKDFKLSDKSQTIIEEEGGHCFVEKKPKKIWEHIEKFTTMHNI